MSCVSATPAVSLIMAAYNAERTIGKAIDSVTGQSSGDWELIVVNDGSGDRTGEILEGYARRDDRIRVINQKNSGVSEVRRIGLKAARGEYVIYIDSDDYVDSVMVEEMLAAARESGADITVGDYMIEYEGGASKNVPQREPQGGNLELQRALLDGRLHGTLCAKLIKREVYHRYGCDFREGLWMGEDMVCVLKMLRGGATVAFMGKGYYHYRYVNSGSLSNRGGEESYLRRKAWISTCEQIVGSDFPEEIERRKFGVKYFGLSHGVIGKDEFRSYGKNRWRYFHGLGGSRRYLPGMVLACAGLFGAGKLWCRMVR